MPERPPKPRLLGPDKKLIVFL